MGVTSGINRQNLIGRFVLGGRTYRSGRVARTHMRVRRVRGRWATSHCEDPCRELRARLGRCGKVVTTSQLARFFYIHFYGEKIRHRYKIHLWLLVIKIGLNCCQSLEYGLYRLGINLVIVNKLYDNQILLILQGEIFDKNKKMNENLY